VSPLRLVMIDLTLTPYRLAFHRRLARELEDVRLWSVRLHDRDALPWTIDVPDGIEGVSFDAPARRGLPRAATDAAKGARLSRWLRDVAPDAVVIGGYADLARLAAIDACWRRGVPCFIFGDGNARGDLARGARRRVKELVLPRLLRRCSGVLACGSLGREFFRRYGVPDERIFLAPYEPDYEALARVAPEEVAAARAKHGLEASRRRLLFCGRLAPEKRVDLLIDAFAAIAHERPGWELAIVGDGALAAALRARVPAALADRVRFVGFVEKERLAAIYLTCDALVVPSDFEPWGVVVNEAVACGLALVCSDVVGAAADLLQDGVNGRQFRAGDLAGLTSALRDVTRAERLDAMRAAAPRALAEWRRVADPVDGVRRALASVGLTPGAGPRTARAAAPPRA
jgi:glycosyltransferase involved in cell wall biosynthesis